jgi:eukaryotic-like serine/threonine-protein kinase
MQALEETPLFEVFAAQDRVQGREVCVRILKEPFARETAFVEALKRVVLEHAHIQHSYLERVSEVDEDDGSVFLVSDLSKGASLDERLKRLGYYSIPLTVSAAIRICEGLQALHGEGRVHGDVGAHSIVVPSDGEARLQLAGLWKSYSESSSAGVAVIPQMAPYLAPEITAGQMPTPASDVYAVGVLIFRMLSGRFPFMAESASALAAKHATDAVPNVRMLSPSVPHVLAEIVKKAMAKDPGERYVTAGDLLSDLRMMQDALRFGKSLTWPIRAEQPVEVPKVAPAMTAAKAETAKAPADPAPKTRRQVDRDPDVPVWMKTLMAFFAGLLVVMVIIWVIFNSNRPRTVSVPDLRGLTAMEASERLKMHGLKMRVRDVPHEQVPPQRVIEMNPQPNEEVYEGSWVTLVVSSGSQFIAVPDLRGLTLDRAKATLASLNLSVDDRVQEVQDREVPAGMIVRQIPERGTRVERDTQVQLFVSVGNERPRQDPDANVKHIYTATIRLTDIDAPVRVRVDMIDARGTKKVYDLVHEPDDEVEVIAEGYGSKVLFRIFYDNEMVKQVEAHAN